MSSTKTNLKRGSATVISEATPAGGGFAVFFSLQAGTVLTSTAIFSVALITFFYNLSAPNNSQKKAEYITQYTLIYVYICLVFVGTGIVSTFAFTRTPKWLLVGAIFVTVTSALWFIMSLLSFFPSIQAYKYLCIMDRCPPTHWIFDVPWRSGHVQIQPHSDDMSTRSPSSSGTSDKPNGDNKTTHNGDNNSSTTANATIQFDLNSSPTAPPAATGTLAADCNHKPTISNEYLGKELHDLAIIERMKKRQPSNKDDDRGDEDTRLDNVVYDHESDENPDVIPSNESATTTTTLSTTTLSTTTVLSTITATDTVEDESSSTNDVNNTTRAVNESEIIHSERSNKAVRLFMSSITVIYTKDMFGENLTLSVISFILFSAFLVYGLVCMFFLHKQLVKRKRAKENEDDVGDEEESRISLETHPSKKSERSH